MKSFHSSIVQFITETSHLPTPPPMMRVTVSELKKFIPLSSVLSPLIYSNCNLCHSCYDQQYIYPTYGKVTVNSYIHIHISRVGYCRHLHWTGKINILIFDHLAIVTVNGSSAKNTLQRPLSPA